MVDDELEQALPELLNLSLTVPAQQAQNCRHKRLALVIGRQALDIGAHHCDAVLHRVNIPLGITDVDLLPENETAPEPDAEAEETDGENFSGFMLTTSATNHDHAEIVENVERYVCGVQDLTA